MSGFDPLPGWFLVLDTLWFKVDIISGKSQEVSISYRFLLLFHFLSP
jgi:hypothetical protein